MLASSKRVQAVTTAKTHPTLFRYRIASDFVADQAVQCSDDIRLFDFDKPFSHRRAVECNTIHAARAIEVSTIEVRNQPASPSAVANPISTFRLQSC